MYNTNHAHDQLRCFTTVAVNKQQKKKSSCFSTNIRCFKHELQNEIIVFRLPVTIFNYNLHLLYLFYWNVTNSDLHILILVVFNAYLLHINIIWFYNNIYQYVNMVEPCDYK